MNDSSLLLIDLSMGKNRLGGSALAQVTRQSGLATPDLDEPALLTACFNGVQLLNETGYILAYHDRSDGGVFTTLCEMAFAGRCGLDIDADNADLQAFLSMRNPVSCCRSARNTCRRYARLCSSPAFPRLACR